MNPVIVSVLYASSCHLTYGYQIWEGVVLVRLTTPPKQPRYGLTKSEMIPARCRNMASTVTNNYFETFKTVHHDCCCCCYWFLFNWPIFLEITAG